MTEAAELLVEKARDYDVLARWHEERGTADPDSQRSAEAFAVVAIVLHEVANALDEETA
jgi:hypothetical protein